MNSATANAVQRIEERGGWVVRDRDGNVTEVSLERTWATDNDIDFVVELKTVKKLDLSFTYVTDKGIKKLQALQQLEDLTLDTAEFLTDASMAHLRANRALRRLVVRGVDITDAGMPYVGEMSGLRSLDISYTMLGDVGLEHLPALSELEQLKLGGNMITGLNLNFLKLLPKLKSLSLQGCAAAQCRRMLDSAHHGPGSRDHLAARGARGAGSRRRHWPRDGRQAGGPGRRQLQTHRRPAGHRSRCGEACEAEETAAARSQRRSADD